MTISFRHNYDKLKQDEFTTIRSKSFAKKLSVGLLVEIQSPKAKFMARVDAVEISTVAEVPLRVLQGDVVPFKVNTPGEFVTFLNSLRAPAWQQATLESEMAIITLRKV